MRCDELREELVDFADRELSPLRSAAIAVHVAECPVCRRRVEELRHSLDVAKAVWSANEQPASLRRIEARRAWRRVAAALALAAGVLLALNVWRTPPPQRPGAARVTDATDAALEREIQRAGLGAQMLATADLLAETPGGRDVACERYVEIGTNFANSRAAESAAERHERLCPGG